MTIAVVLLTYNRLEYAIRTLKAAAWCLESKKHDIEWIIASDGDGVDYINSLVEVADKALPGRVLGLSNSARGGYGRNFNLAMQSAHTMADWILPLEDDWEMQRTLDLDNLTEDMFSLGIGCARLGYIGYTQELRGHLTYGNGCGHWLVFDPESSEPHVFAGHPRIEHVPWAREVGPWPEGKAPGETEFEVAHRPAARRRVAWPLDLVKPQGDLFSHIGTVRSY